MTLQQARQRAHEIVHKSVDEYFDQIERTGKLVPIVYHGRWDMLSVEDVKFLIRCGVAID